ncbi:MAG TPA: class A beta-lactamase [Terriglobales bacterium]|nr:class A beta-lactamase [Terriglobales bacterium]
MKKLLWLWLTLLLATAVAAQDYDVVIKNGHIIDGTGSPWYAADVGIRNGRIAAIGDLQQASAKETIDAHGMVVAPGFIDMLGQSELTILVDPHVPSKIFQGITTEITGEGSSIAPQNDAILQADRVTYQHYGITPDWRTFDQYFARLEKQGMGINLASYVGATQVRRMVLGDVDRAPNPAELEQMKKLVRGAMEQGAMGVSTSLQYAPAPYASTEELIALASEAARYGGIYATHMRSEGDGVLTALDEAIRIGREAKIPVEIWHIKAAGKKNWGRMPDVVAKINAARDSGVDISANTYAYTAWFNTFSAFVPPWAHNGGDTKLVERLKDPATRAKIRKDMEDPNGKWDNEWQEIPGPEAILICVVQNPKLLPIQGETLAEVAQEWHKEPIEALFDILVEDQAFTSVAVFGMSQSDVDLALEQPWVSVDNDSQGTSPDGLLGKEHPHPRAYGTFPRILRKYVREEHKLTLPDAIRKFSALPAQKMKLADRGVLKQGLWADVVVFDPNTIRDVATFENPNQLSQGMEYVLVNGVPVIEEGKMTNALPGKVLRGPGYKQPAAPRSDLRSKQDDSRRAAKFPQQNPKVPQNSDLELQMQQLAQAARGKVGAAAMVLETGEAVSLQGGKHFPMQSVYKLPIVMAVLQQVDAGRLKPDQKVQVREADLVPPNLHSPIRDRNPNGNFEMTLEELARAAIVDSDGTASDVLLRLVKPRQVRRFLHSLGVNGIRVENTEQEMAVVDRLQYENWSTPLGAVALLQKLQDGQGLSVASRKLVLKWMKESRTGTRRIRALLPAGAVVADKTGASGTYNGITPATNDIGLIDLPDGKHLAVAVFVSDSAAEQDVREKVIAQIARAAWDWANGPPAMNVARYRDYSSQAKAKSRSSRTEVPSE